MKDDMVSKSFGQGLLVNHKKLDIGCPSINLLPSAKLKIIFAIITLNSVNYGSPQLNYFVYQTNAF